MNEPLDTSTIIFLTYMGACLLGSAIYSFAEFLKEVKEGRPIWVVFILFVIKTPPRTIGIALFGWLGALMWVGMKLTDAYDDSLERG